MKHLKTLLQKLNVPLETINAFEADELPENSDDLIKSYSESRFNYYLNSDQFKDELKKEREKTFGSSKLKFYKDVNRELSTGLSNSEIDSFTSDDEFFAKISSIIDGRSKAGKDEEVEKWKVKASDYKKDFEKLNTRIKEIEEVELPNKIAAIKSEVELDRAFNDLVLSDKELQSLNVNGKEFILSTIKEKMLSNSILKDGKYLNKDGTVIMHPEKEMVISSMEEMYQFYKNKAGLVKVSNAGVNPSGGPITSPITLDLGGETVEMTDEMARQIESFKSMR